MTGTRSRALAAAAAIVGGAGAVAAEVVYTHRLAIVFGVTATAMAAVVSVFLVGMALGAWAGGQLADGRFLGRPTRVGPGALYVGAELVCAAQALLFPALLGLLDPRLAALDGDARLLGNLGGTALLVGVGALASGASFPALVRLLGREGAGPLATLYALNAGGAALGAVAAGLWLPAAVGYAHTLELAAGGHLLAGVGGLLLARRPSAEVPPAAVPPTPALSARAALGAQVLLGATGMAAELGWTKLLEQTGPNAASLCFALVLASYLLGLAVGGTVLHRRWAGAGPHRLLARCLTLSGLVTVGGLGALRLIPPEALDGHIVGLGPGGAEVWRATGVYCSADRLAVYLLAAAAAGAASGAGFGATADALRQRLGGLGRGVGFASASGIGAGVLVSLWLGLLPVMALGVVRTLALLSAGALLVAAGLGGAGAGARLVRLGGVLAAGAAVFVLPPWAGLPIQGGERVVAFVESSAGPSAVTIPSGGLPGDTAPAVAGARVYTHGERVGGMALDLEVPLALHPAPRRVLDIAFGTGVNIPLFLADPAVEDFTCVDIDAALPTLAAAVPRAGAHLFEPPRSRFVHDDGRHLLRLPGEPWDVVYSDVATYAQYAELGTAEFFRLVRSRLAPGGSFTLKLHLNTLTREGGATFVATLLSVFDDVVLFREQGPVAIAVAFNGRPSRAALERRWTEAAAIYGSDLERRLGARLYASHAELAAWATEGRFVQTDDQRLYWPKMLVGPYERARPQPSGTVGLLLHLERKPTRILPELFPEQVPRAPPPRPRGSGEVPIAARVPYREWWGGVRTDPADGRDRTGAPGARGR